MYFLLASLAALSFTVGGIFMKQSDGLKRLAPSLWLYLFFGAGASLQAIAMRKAELGVTYILVLGLESILAFAFGVLLFKEGFSALKLGGVALIVLGILLLHRAET